MAQTDKQFAQLLEIIANSKLFSELEEQTLISDDSFFASINTGLDDAKKIKLPLLRGYNGDWNASTNTPTLINGTGVAGTVHRVSTQGTRDLGNGALTYGVDEIIYYNSSKWVKLTQSQISDIAGLQTELDDLSALIQSNTDDIDALELNNLSVTVNGNPFTLKKSIGNTLTSLEIDDIIVLGFWDATEFISLAIYLGGDKDVKTNWNILESTTGL